MRKENLSIVIGFFLILGSISASIIFNFHFWSSFYLLGAFTFFGGLNYELGSRSVYSYVLKKQWGSFLIIYSVGTILGFLVDIVYGRNIANLWYYPHLVGINNYIFPILFYYPFGGLQVYEIFYFCKSIFSKKLGLKKAYNLPDITKIFISNLLIIFLILGFIVPLLNKIFNLNNYANEIMIFIMILTTFSPDALVYKITKESILLDFIQGEKLVLLTMISSWFIAAVLTEVPNTFSWEWIYHNIPFTNFELFKINILIFTFGWFFLVFVPVRLIDLVKLLFKLENR